MYTSQYGAWSVSSHMYDPATWCRFKNVCLALLLHSIHDWYEGNWVMLFYATVNTFLAVIRRPGNHRVRSRDVLCPGTPRGHSVPWHINNMDSPKTISWHQSIYFLLTRSSVIVYTLFLNFNLKKRKTFTIHNIRVFLFIYLYLHVSIRMRTLLIHI